MGAGWGPRVRRDHRIRAHGHLYHLDPDLGPHVGRPIREGRPYEQALLEHIYEQHFLGQAIDVGAHIGNHALWLAIVCGLRVRAFEPVLHETLLRNVRRNGIGSGVDVYPTALGDREDQAWHAGDGRLGLGHGPIPVRRLDEYDFHDVSVMKVDVEGMEAAVLRGAEQTIRRERPVIFAEEWADSPHWHESIAEVLEPFGYELTYLFTPPEANTPMGKWESRRG